MDALIAVGLGLLVGLIMGALGGGGSILTVPALVYVLGETPHAAATSSLVIVGITAVAGTLTHARAGTVRWKQGVSFGALGVLGSYPGSRLSATADPQWLLAGFAVVMLGAAVAMLRRSGRGGASEGESGELGADDANPGFTRRRDDGVPGAVRTGHRVDLGTAGRLTGAAVVVGLLTGFFGVGGGFIVAPSLVLILGFNMHAAVGTSLLVITLNAATALSARLGSVDVDWSVALPFTIAAIAGVSFGGRVARRSSPQMLSRAFAYLLIAVAGYVAARSLPHLL